MADLYENVARELSKLSSPCTSCGFCCHFDAAEHSLYASNLETFYVFDKYQAEPMLPRSEVCPFLVENKCSIRDRRMLGCRTYFRLHNKEERVKAEEIYERTLVALKKLHKKYDVNWDYQNCMNAFEEEFGLEEIAE